MEFDVQTYGIYGGALLIVLILIVVVFWIIRSLSGGAGGKGRRGSRLGIVEAAVVDRTRRLVLIRRDAVEHLVMIGGPQDVVVETNITKNDPSLTASASATGPGGPDFTMRPGAQAAVTAEPEKPEPRLAQAAHEPPPAPELEPEAADDYQPPERQAEHPEPPVREVAEAAPAGPPPQAAPPSYEDAPQRPAEPEPRPQEPAVRQDDQSGPEEPAPRTEMAPRRPVEEPPRPAAPARPWPPSEGRFREAQRRFAERSDYNPPGRGGQNEQSTGPGGHPPPERQVVNRAAPDGMPPPDQPREVPKDGPTREPANLNVRPGEDR